MAEERPQDVTPVRSRTLRTILVVVGTICVGIGMLGVFLPVLPTTPFLLVAAACYARSSERFYSWLLNSRGFGPLIRNYRENKTIPLRAKILAVSMITVTIGLSVAYVIPLTPVKVLVVAIGAVVCLWLLSHPSEPPAADE